MISPPRLFEPSDWNAPSEVEQISAKFQVSQGADANIEFWIRGVGSSLRCYYQNLRRKRRISFSFLVFRLTPTDPTKDLATGRYTASLPSMQHVDIGFV
jgi:hypothetical protein